MTGLFSTRPALQFGLGLLIAGIAVLVTSNWIVEGRLIEAALVWSVTIGLTLLSYPRFLLGVCLASFSLPIFLLRHTLTVATVTAAGLVVILALALVRNRVRWSFGWVHVLCVLYAVNLLVIMQVRGFGLLVAGGDAAGAMSYLRIFLAIVPIFAVAWYPLAERHWKWVIVGLGAGSVLMIVADLLYAYNIGVSVLRFFIAGSGMRPGEAEMMASTGEGLLRFSGGKETAIWISLALVALARPEHLFGMRTWVFLPVFVVILVCAAVSGFRSAFIIVGGVFIVAAFLGGKVTVPRALALALVSLIGLLGVYAFAKDMPLAFQRAVSFLPGIDINPIASANALETVDWRLEVWRRAVEEIPQYLVVGKGFTFSVSAFMLGQISNVDWALLNSTYHNGPLSALIITGIPGVLLIFALHVVALVRHFRLQFGRWQSTMLQRFHLAFLAYLIVEVIFFWAIYGDIAVSVVLLFRILALLEGFVATEQLVVRRVAPLETVGANPEPPPLGEAPVARVLPKPRPRRVAT